MPVFLQMVLMQPLMVASTAVMLHEPALTDFTPIVLYNPELVQPLAIRFNTYCLARVLKALKSLTVLEAQLFRILHPTSCQRVLKLLLPECRPVLSVYQGFVLI